MSENTGTIRLSKAAKEIGVGISTIVEHLGKKGHKIESNPNSKITDEQYAILLSDFQSDKKTKEDAKSLGKAKLVKKEETGIAAPKAKAPVTDEEEDDGILIKSGLVPEVISKTDVKKDETPAKGKLVKATELESGEDKPGLTVLGKVDLDSISSKTKPEKKGKKSAETKTTTTKSKKAKQEEEVKPVEEVPAVSEQKIETIEKVTPEETEAPMLEPNYEKLSGLKVMGKIELPTEPPKKQPVASSDNNLIKKKRRRKNFVGGSDNIDSKKIDQ
ncbi:MAG: hypothetical protein ACK5FU_06375 [Bacteroidota bacterium]